MSRKEFKRHNEGFVCQVCKVMNPPLIRGERNHCRACLYSLHVDVETPGDRQSSCGGAMQPIALEYKGSKGFMLKHHCVKCGKEILNSTADDDERIERVQ